MKKLLFFALTISMLFFASAAFGFGDYEDNDTIKNKGGIVGDKNHHNIIVQGNNLGTNAGGEINVRNNNRNTNTNTNRNTNTNTNLNCNTNRQSQGQGQDQKQAQGQKQSIKIEAPPVNYDHITPDIGKTDAELLEYKGASTIRTLFSILAYDDDELLTMKEAKNASKGAKVKVVKALLWEADTQLTEINHKTISGKYMGSITLMTDTATADQIVAYAAKEAMYAGATSFDIITRSSTKVSATKYGIDFGSSASVATKADGSIVVAPGATLGWSKAKASNIVVREVYIMLFRDDSLIVK